MKMAYAAKMRASERLEKESSSIALPQNNRLRVGLSPQPASSSSRVVAVGRSFIGALPRVLTIATAARMMAVAITVCAPIVSEASNHPRKTATTGFTYAYVDTRDGDATVSSQVKAVNAMIEPNTVR